MAFRYKGELVFFDEIGSSGLFYAPTLGICIAVEDYLVDRMKSFLAGEVEFPEFEGLLEGALGSKVDVFDLSKGSSRYCHVALGLTENCTLACAYCHADAGADSAMPTRLIDAAADYARDRCLEEGLRGINLSFAVGGEPTANMAGLKYTLARFKEAAAESGVPLTTSMTTNGYYDGEVARYVGRSIDNILVSLDGLEGIQNLHRPTRGGKGSFSQVMKSIDIFSSMKGEVSLRATVSKQSAERMAEFVEFLGGAYPNVHLVLEPLVPLGRGAESYKAGVSEPGRFEFVEAFWSAFMLGRKKGVSVSTSALNAERLVSGFCGAMHIPSFTVTGSGIVTTCERDCSGENYGYGVYDPARNAFVLDGGLMARNRALASIPEECDECICRYHCAGDCPDVRTIGYDRCEVNRELLRRYLALQLGEGGREPARSMSTKERG